FRFQKIIVMKRRNFIKTTAIGSSILSTSGLLSFNQVFQTKKELGDLIDPIIPIEIFPNFENEIKSDIIDLNKRYGFRRFLLTGPSKEFRYTGFPDKQVFIDLGEQVLSF